MEPALARPRGPIVIVAITALGLAGACATGRPPAVDRTGDAPPSATTSAPAGRVDVAPSAPPEVPPPRPASTPSTSSPAIVTPAPSAAASPAPSAVCTAKLVAPPFGAQPRCDRDEQCTLIASKCCFCGEIPRSEVRAAHVDGRLSACAPGTSCPACAAGVPEGITGACVDHVCRGVEKICK